MDELNNKTQEHKNKIILLEKELKDIKNQLTQKEKQYNDLKNHQKQLLNELDIKEKLKEDNDMKL